MTLTFATSILKAVPSLYGSTAVGLQSECLQISINVHPGIQTQALLHDVYRHKLLDFETDRWQMMIDDADVYQLLELVHQAAPVH